MTKEELDKKRDEYVEKHFWHEVNDIIAGWDKAVETLWPEVQELDHALELSAATLKTSMEIVSQQMEQNKKLVEALKEIKAEKKDTCSVCNAAYFIPEIAEDALKEMGLE